MRLRRLTINTLPGITPGFTFEPPDAGVILVTGPNAIGKSSLARALKHLLGGIDRRCDPPALSLEAEFDSSGTRWQVRRNGGQILWMRDGESATAPQLPSGEQFNLYRLSMESLLADDQDDQALAGEIWRALRGGFDLDALRITLGNRWGRREERALLEARNALSDVEGRYAALRAEEATLPELERRIRAADQARGRLGHLQQALALHRAIDERKRSQESLDRFSADMAKLKGDELQRLDSWNRKAEGLLEGRKEQRRQLEEAQRKLAQTGLHAVAPEPEQVARIEATLQAIGSKASDRKHASDAATKAQARLNDALTLLKGDGEQPDLGADSLERAREIVESLVNAQARLRKLTQQLDWAGEPLDQLEVDQLRDGVSALRAWLASSKQCSEPSQPVSPLNYAALALAALAAVTAFIEEALLTLTAVVAAGAALLWATIVQRKPSTATRSPADEAKVAFESTDLDPPEHWTDATVRDHLRRNIEHRLNTLILRQQQAEGAAELHREAAETRSKIERLKAEKSKLATEIGIDPELADAPFYRFIDVTSKWDQARSDCKETEAALNTVETEIAAQASEVREFLNQWRSADAPPLAESGSDSAVEELRIAWRQLHERLKATQEAHHDIESCEKEIRSLENQLADIGKDVRSLFDGVALDAAQHDELADRIARREEWKTARDALRDTQRDESKLRTVLAEHADLIAAVDGGDFERIEQELASAERTAKAYTEHVEERKGINTRLEEARGSHDLEQAASVLENATATLNDKRSDALRQQATEVLLDEVEGQFTNEHEPALLRRAKARFAEVTAHAFRLELRDDNRFAAWDAAQEQLRTLEELSSGTRMQLLLALRLAWTEAQEQGGESLPLFLDEALTTSDEDRFAVMATTLTRLAEAGERQIFYLSARRHESALWRQATGVEPILVDLAEVRFGQARLAPEDFQVETPPSLPSPAGHDAASYAALIGVQRLDPHLEPGGIHLFHLLRDDLELLHRLMAMWRIATLGQLENLLASNAANGAIPDAATRSGLKQRCEATRAWTDLWRQGRGRPVNRSVLEQSGAVSARFITQTAELADELQGDGTALINALRQHRLPRFHASKTDELEQWLADAGHTDKQSRLSAEERRRLTLATVVPQGEAGAIGINQLVNWLEVAESSASSKSL